MFGRKYSSIRDISLTRFCRNVDNRIIYGGRNHGSSRNFLRLTKRFSVSTTRIGHFVRYEGDFVNNISRLVGGRTWEIRCATSRSNSFRRREICARYVLLLFLRIAAGPTNISRIWTTTEIPDRLVFVSGKPKIVRCPSYSSVTDSER